jgi:hypothetical protein
MKIRKLRTKKFYNIGPSLTLGRSCQFGKWTTEDYKLFLNFAFSDTKSNPGTVNAVEYIENLPTSVIYESAKILNRLPGHVYQSFRGFIKPTLLSYHNGTLLIDIKAEFFKYLIEKKVNTITDIDWPDAIKRFPGQNPRSLCFFIIHFRKFPLHKEIESYLANMKNCSQKRSTLKPRLQLILLYNKARGVLDDDVTGAGCFSKIRIFI